MTSPRNICVGGNLVPRSHSVTGNVRSGKVRFRACSTCHFLWHVDGWDKLAHFGIFIHAAVDDFSRRILWLEANSTNKNPGMIASHYLNTTKAEEGLPTSDFRLPTSDFRLPTSDFRLPTSDFRLPTSDFRLQTSDFRLQTSDFRLQTSDFRLQTSDFRLQTSDFRLQTSDFRLQTSDFRLQTSDFRLQTSDFRLEEF